MPIKQLEKLLIDIAKAYEDSPLKEYCIKNNKEWHYSLLGSKFIENPVLLIGLNWGAGTEARKNKETGIKERVDIIYKPQTIDGCENLPAFHEMTINDLGSSFIRLKNYIKEYGKISIENVTWTNYCFFRSYSDKELTAEDYKLTEPIFANLLDISRPRSMICVSKALYNFLNNQNLLEDKKEKIIKIHSKSNYTVVKAKLHNYDFFCLPHPNTPATSKARKECWDFCFEQ